MFVADVYKWIAFSRLIYLAALMNSYLLLNSFFKIFIYLLAASGLSCSTWDLSLWQASFSPVVAHGLQGMWAL